VAGPQKPAKKKEGEWFVEGRGPGKNLAKGVRDDADLRLDLHHKLGKRKEQN